MGENRKFAVIGGDLRQIQLANELAAKGYAVAVYGLDSNIEPLKLPTADSLGAAIAEATVVILPLPASFDGAVVNAPMFAEDIEITALLRLMNKNQILLAGKIDEKTAKLIDIHNIYAIDYFLREELTISNAIPTAEGGLEIALAELPITVHGSNCLVLGYGRIGKVLCKMLGGIGANVTAAARRHDALAWIDAYGYGSMHIDALPNRVGEFDVVFNTIPHKLITAEVLGAAKKDVLIIDLASRPGGVDMAAAQELGVKAIWALSLPGKVAPITAGNIIMQAVLNICEGLGI